MRGNGVAGLWGWLLAGCGVVGFPTAGPADGGPGDGAAIDGALLPVRTTQSSSDLVVEVEGRFLLRFAANREWMAVDWRDGTDLARSLGPGPSPIDFSREVVTGTLVTDGQEWLGAGKGQGTTLSTITLSPGRAEFSTQFDLVWPSRTATVRTTNRISADGRWDVTVEIDAVGQEPLPGLEYADAHLDPAGPWTVATPDADSYRFRRDGASPQPTLTVTRGGPLGLLQSDEPNNRYWSESAVDATVPIVRSWTVQVWPPS